MKSLGKGPISYLTALNIYIELPVAEQIRDIVAGK